MLRELDDSSTEVSDLVRGAASACSLIDIAKVLRLADEAGLNDGRARTRLLIAHLQGGDAEQAIALCTAAIATRADLADFCKELVNHADATRRTLDTFIGVVAAAMPAHPAASLDKSCEFVGRAVFDAMWSGEAMVVAAPIRDGFSPSFEGVLISTEEPLRRFTTFAASRRSADIVHLQLHDKARFTSDAYWVAPPCLMIAGDLGAGPSFATLLKARLRRGMRRVTAVVNR